MSVESTRKIMEEYWDGHGGKAIAENAVFIDMATGQESRGLPAIREMFRHMYMEAFEAEAKTVHTTIADGRAVFEGEFYGIHTGEFAGIPATGRHVRVPLVVSYDLENDQIVTARVYHAALALAAELAR